MKKTIRLALNIPERGLHRLLKGPGYPITSKSFFHFANITAWQGTISFLEAVDLPKELGNFPIRP